MSNTIENDQSQRRNSFMKQLAALRFLLRQALPVRNDNAGGSNLSVLLESVLDESRWLKDGKYQSPEVINELIEIMAHKVLRSLLSDISSRKWYAIMADETRDISNREQLVLCIRSVSDNYVVHEYMVGLYQLDDTTSSTIHSCLKDSLLRMSLYRLKTVEVKPTMVPSHFKDTSMVLPRNLRTVMLQQFLFIASPIV